MVTRVDVGARRVRGEPVFPWRSALGLAIAFLACGPVTPARAFVGAPVGGQPKQVDLQLRVELERGNVEPNDNTASWQRANWEIYTIGAGYTGKDFRAFLLPFFRVEYSFYSAPPEMNERGDVPPESCLGRSLGPARCEFHPGDRGSLIRPQIGFDLVHEPRFALGVFFQGTIPIGVDSDRFVLPRVDHVGGGINVGVVLAPWLRSQSRIYFGTGMFDGSQNGTVALVHLFAFEAKRWLLPWKIGIQVGPYFDADLTERYDPVYDAAYFSGVPNTPDGTVSGPGDTRDRIRMMRFGASFLPYVQITERFVIEAGYTQKLFGYDTPATKFFSIGARGVI
jgi:hypothetical protein